eukprot:430228-Prymnesium_polylepis.1
MGANEARQTTCPLNNACIPNDKSFLYSRRRNECDREARNGGSPPLPAELPAVVPMTRTHMDFMWVSVFPE